MSVEGSVVPRLYLLDIEGTVAPLSLTGDVLFPYARRHLAEFLEKNTHDKAVGDDLLLLLEENLREAEPGVPRLLQAEEKMEAAGRGLGSVSVGGPLLRERSLAYLLWLMDRDRKSTALKSLQGKIWKSGFESGALKGTLFPDVPAALERWASHARVAIYSSGSVEAQNLLFGHTNYGDLTPRLSGYFDTRTGAKTASASYAAIAAKINVACAEILFLSDIVRELDAAREAGCGTRLMVREGNAQVAPGHRHSVITSFEGI